MDKTAYNFSFKILNNEEPMPLKQFSGKVMLVVNAAHFAQMVRCRFVVHVTNQGVARVGGHRLHPPLVEQHHSLFEQARLWVVWMN